MPLQFNYTYDPFITKICKRSSMELAVLKKKQVTFANMASFTEELIKELNYAKTKHDMWKFFEGLTRFVDITSKVYIALASAGVNLGYKFAAASAGKVLATGALIDVSNMIIKAFNDELSTKDAVKYSAKSKIDALSSNSQFKTVGKFADIIFIGIDIKEQIIAFNSSGSFNPNTFGLKKQLSRYRDRLLEIDAEIAGLTYVKRC